MLLLQLASIKCTLPLGRNKPLQGHSSPLPIQSIYLELRILIVSVARGWKRVQAHASPVNVHDGLDISFLDHRQAWYSQDPLHSRPFLLSFLVKGNSHSYTHLIRALGIVRDPTVWGFITSKYIFDEK